MQLVPFFAIPLSNLQTLKIHTNLMKIATNNNNFFAVVIRRKRKFILAKKNWGRGVQCHYKGKIVYYPLDCNHKVMKYM